MATQIVPSGSGIGKKSLPGRTPEYGVTTQPNTIEVSDFTDGWVPSQEPADLDAGQLIDVLNLLPQPISGTLAAREGFERVRAPFINDGSHWLQQVLATTVTDHRFVLVFTDGTSGADNVQLWDYDLDTNVARRMDTAGRTWANPLSPHWGISIQGTWFGGTLDEAMYSFKFSDGTWDADASTKSSWRTIVDATNDGVDPSTQIGTDYAWKGDEHAWYSGKVYAANHSIRYDSWDSSENWYEVGDRVSREAVWGTTAKYWKSFRCIKAHDPSDSTTTPGTGSATGTYWKKLKFGLPVDDDGKTKANFDFVPIAAQTSVGAWFADRLWLQYANSGEGHASRLQFSAPLKFGHGKDINDLDFDPTDFAPGNDMNGDGGGWIDVYDGANHGVIRGLRAYGQYLLVFKQDNLYVLSGSGSDTFNRRLVSAGTGIVGPHAHCEHSDGLVYFLDDDGLFQTDGTSVQPVPGYDAVREYLRDRMGAAFAATGNDNHILTQVYSYGPYVWIAIPVEGDAEPHITIVYHPDTQSFWKTDLPVLSFATQRTFQRKMYGFFSTPSDYGTDILYQMTGDLTTDDTGASVQATQPIAWRMRTAWWSFGVLREQRRIRRIWAVVKGAMTYTLTVYRDWSDSLSSSVSRVVSATHPVHVEGMVVPDAHSLSLEVASTAAAAEVLGLSVDTEPRRIRYHV